LFSFAEKGDIVSRRLMEVEKLVDKNKKYSLAEAVSLVKQTAKAKFDETVEIHIRLNVDPKKSDQSVRGTVVLPHGIGKTKRVVVVAKGEKVKEAKDAGADEVGDAELIERISKGWMDFDILVATPDVMKDLTKLGKVLGPKGLMPNPKSGTVTFDVSRAVGELKAGRVEYKVDAYGIIHSILGKASFPEKKLQENAQMLIDAVLSAKPATVKGGYVKSITLSSTMGPGISIQSDNSKSE
jgi:large subunit ribosomal protein L1